MSQYRIAGDRSSTGTVPQVDDQSRDPLALELAKGMVQELLELRDVLRLGRKKINAQYRHPIDIDRLCPPSVDWDDMAGWRTKLVLGDCPDSVLGGLTVGLDL